MKRPHIFLGLLLVSSPLVFANALQTPEELRKKGFVEERQEKARENMDKRMKAKEVIEQEKQEEREEQEQEQEQEQETIERDVRDEMWGKQGPKYVP